MKRDKWLELATRCEKATGPDREIDADICILANWIGPTQPHQMFQGPAINLRREEDWNPLSDDDWLDWEDADGDPWSDCAPRLTMSLDAITALIERELPEAEFNSTGKVQGDGIGGLKRYAYAWLVIGPRQYGGVVVASEALGRCAAFCRAMAEKEPAP
jgi:hypothetical protein